MIGGDDKKYLSIQKVTVTSNFLQGQNSKYCSYNFCKSNKVAITITEKVTDYYYNCANK